MKIEIPEKYVELAKKKGVPIEEAKKIYEKSLIEPNTPIGIVTAQSISEASTQAALRAKHIAGIQEVRTTATLPRLIEIFDAHERAEAPSMTIYLKKEYSDPEKVEEFLLKKLIEIKIEDVLKDYEVDLEQKKIKLIFNKENLSANKMSMEDLKTKLSLYNIEDSGSDYIVIKPNTKEFHKEALRIVNKIKNTTLSGIPGITRGIVSNEGGDVVIRTEGSNLRKVLELEEVDATRTYSNDIMETYEVLGIEAARNLIVEEAAKALQSGGLKVDIRHVMLVADLMCYDGSVVGVTRYGISSFSPSILSRMAFEMPVKHLIEAAVLHEKEEFKYLINNIITNQIIPMGTGRVKVVVKEDKEEKDGNAGGN